MSDEISVVSFLPEPLRSYILLLGDRNIGTVNIDPMPRESPPYAHGELRICRVFVRPEYRGKGFGTKMLDHVCAEADREMRSLVLEASPYGGPDDLPKLLKFYRRAGFVSIDPLYEAGMRRLPK